MEISQRKKRILAAVVDEYIRTAEPVGSRTIAQIAELGCSSATIRNELSELTALGYLEQPHTSAGRIPSPQGYRFYVNELMERQRVSVEEAEAINARLSEKMEQLDKLMSDAGKLAGQLTGYPALTLSAPRAATIKRFDLLYIDANTFIIVVLLGDNTVKNKLVHLPFSVEQRQIQKLSALFNAGFTNIPEESVTPVLISATERAARDTMGLASIIAAYAIEVLSESRAGAAFVTGESAFCSSRSSAIPIRRTALSATFPIPTILCVCRVRRPAAPSGSSSGRRTLPRSCAIQAWSWRVTTPARASAD